MFRKTPQREETWEGEGREEDAPRARGTGVGGRGEGEGREREGGKTHHVQRVRDFVGVDADQARLHAVDKRVQLLPGDGSEVSQSCTAVEGRGGARRAL